MLVCGDSCDNFFVAGATKKLSCRFFVRRAAGVGFVSRGRYVGCADVYSGVQSSGADAMGV